MFAELREQILAHVYRELAHYISQPALGLLIGMLFGDDTVIPTTIMDGFRFIGMSHVVAASGFNVSLVALMTQHVCSLFHFPKKVILSTSLVSTTIYCWLCGFSPSLLRAELMYGWGAFGYLLTNRMVPVWWRLSGTLLLLSIVAPSVVGSLSFGLSFWASLGIIVTSRLMQKNAVLTQLSLQSMDEGFALEKPISFLKESFFISLGAAFFTTPLLLAEFGELQLLSVIPNTLLLPFTPILGILGALYLVTLFLITVMLPDVSWLMGIGAIPLTFLFELFIMISRDFLFLDRSLITFDTNRVLLSTLWWLCIICVTILAMRKRVVLRA